MGARGKKHSHRWKNYDPTSRGRRQNPRREALWPPGAGLEDGELTQIEDVFLEIREMLNFRENAR